MEYSSSDNLLILPYAKIKKVLWDEVAKTSKYVDIYSLPCVFVVKQSTSMNYAAHVFLTF